MNTWGSAPAPSTREQRLRRTLIGAGCITAAIVGYCIPFGWWL